MKITAKKLEKAGACDIKKFKKRWPRGCAITRKNCEVAFGEGGLGLDVEWAAEELLSPDALADVRRAGSKACGECENRNRCDFPRYCALDKAQIEAFYLAAREV